MDPDTSRAGERGFTLVEILIALVVMGIVGASLVSLFRFQHQQSVRQNEGVRAQQNARAGLDMLVRELKNAGYDPRGTAGAGLITATSDTVAWSADLDGDADVADVGTAGDEVVRYFFQADSNAVVRQEPGESPRRVADGVTALTFAYLDADGAVVAPADADQVEIVIQFETPDGVLPGHLRTRVALRNETYKDDLALALDADDATPDFDIDDDEDGDDDD